MLDPGRIQNMSFPQNMAFWQKHYLGLDVDRSLPGASLPCPYSKSSNSKKWGLPQISLGEVLWPWRRQKVGAEMELHKRTYSVCVPIYLPFHNLLHPKSLYPFSVPAPSLQVSVSSLRCYINSSSSYSFELLITDVSPLWHVLHTITNSVSSSLVICCCCFQSDLQNPDQGTWEGRRKKLKFSSLVILKYQ